MEENDNGFRNVKVRNVKKSNENGFFKSIIVPFISGIIGASLVVGTAFSIPSVRNKLIEGPSGASSSVNTPNNTDPSKINSTAISLENYSETSMGVADKVLPSIVGIKIEYNVSSFFGLSSATATGSGIIISEDGYILTNNHVVSTNSSSSYYEVTEAVSVKVTLYNDDTVYDAKLVGKDDQTDLAVIKIDKTGLTPATLGDSDSVRVGEFAMAIGCPLGLNTTATSGIISAVNREVTTTDGGRYVVMQTDAAINSGNSGGALVNSKGEVIGINTLKLSGTGVEGIGFAIPINSTTDVVSQLIEFKKVKRPYIGISGQELTQEKAERYNLVEGVYIVEIEDFSAAQKAGIKIGDTITEIDGQHVKTVDEINEIKNKHQIGDKLKIKIYRNKEYIDIELILEEQP